MVSVGRAVRTTWPRLVGAVAVAFASFSMVGVDLARAQSSGGEDVVGLPPPTSEEKKQFAELVKKGRRAYADGHYDEAISFFERAYDTLSVPGLHYRIALCHEKAGRIRKAIDRYERFVAVKPHSPKYDEVQQRIARLERQTYAVVRVESTPSSAKVFVRPGGAEELEEDPRGTTPLELEVDPGRVEIVVKKSGFETRRETLDVEGGERYEVARDLTAPDSVVPVDDHTATIAAAVAGGVGFLSYGTFYGIGRHCLANRSSCSSGLYSTAVAGSYAGAVIGLAGVSTAVVLWQTSDDSGGEFSLSHLRLRVGPTGIGISGQF